MGGRSAHVSALACAGLMTLAGTALIDPFVTWASPVVGPLIQLTTGSPFPHSCAMGAVPGYEVEPTATFDAPAKRVVAAWQADRAPAGADGIVSASSGDGGLTWKASVVPGLSLCSGGLATGASDPWLTAGPDGEVYLSSLELRGGPSPATVGTTLVVARSSDGGTSWAGPVTVAPDEGKKADKPMIAADPLHAGVAYLTWTQREGLTRELVFSRTRDGGMTWSRPTAVAPPPRGELDLFPQLEVQLNGNVTIVYTQLSPYDPSSFSTQARVSQDGGATWSPAAQLNRLRSFIAPFAYPPVEIVRANAAVFALASGPGGAYVVNTLIHQDRRYPPRLPAMSEIVLTRQLPNGSWVPPTTIARVHGMAFLPTVATTASQHVAVVWYQMAGPRRKDKPFSHRSNPLATKTTVQSAISPDGGMTWSEQPLGASFNLQNARKGFEIFVGDYQALTAIGEGFDAIDVRTPTRSGADGSDVFAQALAG